MQAKRKRADSEEEEADQAERKKKEEEQKQKKLISRQNRNRVAQQKTLRQGGWGWHPERCVEQQWEVDSGELIYDYTHCVGMI